MKRRESREVDIIIEIDAKIPSPHPAMEFCAI